MGESSDEDVGSSGDEIEGIDDIVGGGLLFDCAIVADFSPD